MTAIQFLLEWALRSSILILSGALLLRALRVKDPAAVLAAWTAMLCASLAIPVLTATLPNVPVTLPRAASRVAEAPSATYDAAPEASPAILPQTSTNRLQRARGAEGFDWRPAAIILYAVGALAMLLRLCAGILMSARLHRESRATQRETGGIEIRESNRVACPIALGIVRSSILLPEDWREWDSVRLDAVLAHELSHIRRHDPAVQLLSASHRALLWFSPLSWYLHREIVRAAEEVSDDAAVAAIHDPAGYAKVLLEFMQRGIRSPKWQGVPMARYGRPDQRIDRILDATSLSRGVTRRMIAAILLLGAPLAYVVAAARPQSAAPPQAAPLPTNKALTFDVASIKPFHPAQSPSGRKGGRGGGGATGPGTSDPSRIHYAAIRLKDLVMTAYDVREFQIVGPGWLDSADETTRFVIDATMPPGTTKQQMRVMLQNLLAERFKLAIHRDTRERPKYTLTAAKNGPKMKESSEAAAPADDAAPMPPGGRSRGIDAYGFPVWQAPRGGGVWRFFINGRGRLGGSRITMQDLADELTTWQLRTPVTDETGLKGKYDVLLTFSVPDWKGEPIELPDGMGRMDPSVASEPLPDLFAAVQSQLGLNLEAKKGPVSVIVIDHIEKTPTEN